MFVRVFYVYLAQVELEEEAPLVTSPAQLPSTYLLPAMDVRVGKQSVTALGMRRWEEAKNTELWYGHTHTHTQSIHNMLKSCPVNNLFGSYWHESLCFCCLDDFATDGQNPFPGQSWRTFIPQTYCQACKTLLEIHFHILTSMMSVRIQCYQPFLWGLSG